MRICTDCIKTQAKGPRIRPSTAKTA
jgi:hypothetical protein